VAYKIKQIYEMVPHSILLPIIPVLATSVGYNIHKWAVFLGQATIEAKEHV
jgi:hypothetical protein